MSDAASAPLTPEQIRELLEKQRVSPAPWRVENDTDMEGQPTGACLSILDANDEPVVHDICTTLIEDGALICALRNHADALLTLCDSQALALTQQQQEIARLTQALDAKDCETCWDDGRVAGLREAQKQIAAVTAERDSLKRELIDIGNWRTMRRRSTPHE